MLAAGRRPRDSARWLGAKRMRVHAVPMAEAKLGQRVAASEQLQTADDILNILTKIGHDFSHARRLVSAKHLAGSRKTCSGEAAGSGSSPAKALA